MLNWNPSDPTRPAILQDGRPESPRAHRAFLDYLHLGPGRTIPALLASYTALPSVPSRSYNAIRRWSMIYQWSDRAADFDRLQERVRQAEYEAHSAQVLATGLARPNERVEDLVTIYRRLFALAQTDEGLWIRDVKSIRVDDDRFERVELRRFNGQLFSQLHTFLETIAVETGGRLNHPGPAPAPAYAALNPADYTFDVFTPEEHEQFLRLQEKLLSQAAKRDFSSKNCE